ncbi:MAG: AAA family ATPase [Solirubrobacterales bacterium]|nr:AAA family ATPase [Solirubrobacterales bacterium]
MSSRLVGRAGELAELERARHDAALGRPSLVLLGGDSGVGKTRLVAELERVLEPRAGDQAALVLRGEAVEQGEGELPYGPLLSALRPLVRGSHPALDALPRRTRSQLAALLPGFDDDGSPAESHDPSAQLRLFEALLELLDRLGDTEPVVLVLEDMHWADRSTRAFAQFLARSLRRERIVLVLTYRTDELHRRHALRPLLAELERLERAQRIELAPFDRGQLVEALTDILDEVPSDSLVDRLFARSEGNPLYLEELLAAGLDGRGAAPQSLRDAFLLRIERLSPDARRAARVIAVGRALDEATIAEVSGVTRETLHEALREAVAEHVLVAADDGRLGFRHALLREAVYDDLLPGERVDLHLALAAAYERRDDRDGEWTATIASHYAAAGDQPAALRATVQAALAARDAHAYGDAADLAERALELWPRVAEADRALPLDHVELLRMAAAAHGVAGDRDRAEVLLRSALDELDADSEPRRYSQLLAHLARVQWSLNRGREGVRTAQQALAMLPPEEVSQERASLLAWLARTRHLRGQFRESIEEGEAALAAAVAAGDRRSESEVLNTLGMTEIVLGDAEAGAGRLRRAIDIAREDEDIDGLETAYSNLADTLNLAGRTAQALETAREGLDASLLRDSRSHDWMMLTVSELAFEIGEWETARANLVPTRIPPAGRQLIFRQLVEAEQALGVGEDAAAERALEAVEPLVARSSEPQYIGAFGALGGEFRRRRRELPAAREVVDQALDRIELCTDDVMRIARVSAVGVRVEADLAQRARDLRERREERDAVARARIHVDRLRAAAQAGGPVERAWRAVGVAELARARGRPDAKLWHRAAGEWDAIERPFQAAIARWRAAEAEVEAGGRDAAARTAAAAMRSARALGSQWLAQELSGLAERARLDLERETAPPRPVQEGGAAEDPFGLTPRERQVLALIAEGATNRQIGAALYMAEKTASVHVSRILGKLGVRSRTQAAAMAHRLRLGA